MDYLVANSFAFVLRLLFWLLLIVGIGCVAYLAFSTASSWAVAIIILLILLLLDFPRTCNLRPLTSPSIVVSGHAEALERNIGKCLRTRS